MSLDLDAVTRSLRAHGGDTNHIEAKAAIGGLPDSITSSLSSLANLPGGGMVILGLDERFDFAPVAISNPQVLRQGLADKARSYDPPVELVFVEEEDSVVEGVPVVAAFVLECDRSAKPVRLHSTRQAFIRGWDGDYLMSPLEEQAFLALRHHPRFDRQPVEGATFEDLDPVLVALWSQTVKEQDLRGLGRFEGEELLTKAGIINKDGTPTMAGILALGRHPQQYFPRFVISLSAESSNYSSSELARNVSTISGPIPLMIEAAIDWARSTFDRSIVTGPDGSVRDRYQFPLDAFRELISNALVHRDLASWSHGDAVEVRLRSNELMITNPGGLYGITVDRLGIEGTTSARNARLIELLKFARSETGARVVEALASGIPRILAATELDHLPRPKFYNTDIRFTVILRSSNAALMTEQLPGVNLRGTQRQVALALAPGAKTVIQLENLLELKGPNIRRILRELVDKKVVVQEGGKGRVTFYRLHDGLS